MFTSYQINYVENFEKMVRVLFDSLYDPSEQWHTTPSLCTAGSSACVYISDTVKLAGWSQVHHYAGYILMTVWSHYSMVMCFGVYCSGVMYTQGYNNSDLLHTKHVHLSKENSFGSLYCQWCSRCSRAYFLIQWWICTAKMEIILNVVNMNNISHYETTVRILYIFLEYLL